MLDRMARVLALSTAAGDLIHAEHVAVRTNQIGSQETYVAASAADIEHAHSSC